MIIRFEGFHASGDAYEANESWWKMATLSKGCLVSLGPGDGHPVVLTAYINTMKTGIRTGIEA